MPPKIARIAGYGAFAAIALFVAIYLFVGFLSRHTATGGMMPVLSVVTWISVGVVLLAIIAVHVALGKQLLYLGKGGGPRRI